MKARRLIGVALLVSAIVAPFVLAAFGIRLGRFTVFDFEIGDDVFTREWHFDPNLAAVVPIGLAALAGIVLLILPVRRRP
jgi:hypothetical protein